MGAIQEHDRGQNWKMISPDRRQVSDPCSPSPVWPWAEVTVPLPSIKTGFNLSQWEDRHGIYHLLGMLPVYKIFTSKKTKESFGCSRLFRSCKIVVPVLAPEKLQVSTLATPSCTGTGVHTSLARCLQMSVCSRTAAGAVFHGAQLLSAVFLFDGQVSPAKPTACPPQSWVNSSLVCQRECMMTSLGKFR